MYCQKCRTPLRVDASLDDLNPAAFDLLVGSAVKSQQNAVIASRLNYPSERKELYDRVSKTTGAPLHRRNIPAPQNDDEGKSLQKSKSASAVPPDMSFVEITESQVVTPTKSTPKEERRKSDAQNGGKDEPPQPETSLHLQMVKNEKLFAILSSHSDIDHPICTECTSLLLQSFTARLASASKERDAYASFLKQLQQNAATLTDEDESKADNELADLQRQDEEAYSELLELEAEKAALEAELAELEEESHRLDIEEEAFWASRNAFDSELHNLNTELANLQQRYDHDKQQLEKLQRTNVYNDTFCIGHDGYFGTINGLRLGKLTNQNVEWAEINAAWGQTVLLLATVAERLSFTFQRYRLVPLGSRSRIEKLEAAQTAGSSQSSTSSQKARADVKVLPLHSSGEMAITRMLSSGDYDRALVAFLDCLNQVGEFVQRSSHPSNPTPDTRPQLGRAPSSKMTVQSAVNRVLPYKIQGDKINDVSIKLGAGFQQDDNYTKACKYALTCCKFLLAHVSNLGDGRG
jgi:beclin